MSTIKNLWLCDVVRYLTEARRKGSSVLSPVGGVSVLRMRFCSGRISPDVSGKRELRDIVASAKVTELIRDQCPS